MNLRGRISMLAALAGLMGHAPQEAHDIFAAPRPPRDPPDPKDPKATTVQHKTAADIEVELPPQPGPTVLRCCGRITPCTPS